MQKDAAFLERSIRKWCAHDPSRAGDGGSALSRTERCGREAIPMRCPRSLAAGFRHDGDLATIATVAGPSSTCPRRWGTSGRPNRTVCCVTKHAIEGLTRIGRGKPHHRNQPPRRRRLHRAITIAVHRDGHLPRESSEHAPERLDLTTASTPAQAPFAEVLAVVAQDPVPLLTQAQACAPDHLISIEARRRGA